MTTPRWDQPWVTPVGSAPTRAPGEPGPGVIALVHVAVFFGLSAVGSLTAGLVGRSEPAAAGVGLALALGCVLGGEAAWRMRSGMAAWVGDLLQAAAAVYLFGSVAVLCSYQGLPDHRSTLIASLAALPLAVLLYARHQRLWLQLASVAAAAGALLSALAGGPSVPDPVYGAYLLVLAGFITLGAMSGALRPVPSGCVLGAVLATAGAQVLLAADTLTGSLVTVVVLALVGWGLVASSNTSLLPVSLIAGVLLVPQVLSPLIGNGQAVAVSLTGVSAVTGWLAVDLSQRSVRRIHVGGVFASCTLFVLVGSLITAVADDHLLASVLQALAVTAFFGAAVTARRIPAAVISGLIMLGSLPSSVAQATHGGSTAEGVMSLVAMAGAVWLGIRLSRRPRRPAAAPDQQEISLSGGGEEWTVVAPYLQVFDGVVAILSGAGVPLQVVDRAAGRIIAGDPVNPLLVVAVWATDPVQAHVRAVGSPAAVDQLQRDLTARTAGGLRL